MSRMWKRQQQMTFWCVVQTETSREFTAASYLNRAGYTTYCPRLQIRRKGADRIEPLFPSYLFAQADEVNWSPIRWTVAVVRVVMDGIQPARLPDSEMLKLRRREGPTGLIRWRRAEWVRGRTRLSVIRGPFKDLNGIFAGDTAHQRVQILLANLGQDVRVELPMADVEPLGLAL
jgi:transcriptional antiterminator RfaH